MASARSARARPAAPLDAVALGLAAGIALAAAAPAAARPEADDAPAVASGQAGGADSEPTFQGRPAAAWRGQMLAADPQVRQGAIRALAALGEVEALGRALGDRDPATRRLAALALRDLGERADAAAPWLAGALRDADPALRRLAAEALGALPRALDVSLAPLGRALGDADPDVRLAAARATAALGAASPRGLEHLVAAATGEEDGRVRLAALDALAEIGATSNAAVAALATALADDDLPAARAAAARGLSRGQGAARARGLQALLAGLEDADAAVRRAAADSISALRPTHAEAAAPLLDALAADPSLEVRRAAAGALAHLSAPRAGAAPALAAALRAERDPEVRHLAVVALGRLRQHGAEGAPALALLAEDPQEPLGLRLEALASLVAIGAPDDRPAADEAAGASAGALPASHPDAAAALRAHAAHRTALLARAVASLLGALADPRLGRPAAEALVACGPEGGRALAAAIGRLPAESRLAALAALAKARDEQQRPLVSAAVAVAARLAEAPEAAEREAAAVALASLARGAPQAVLPALVGALADASGGVRRGATAALAALGEAAVPATPALAGLLGDPEAGPLAADALLAIGRPALLALVAALGDARPVVRARAAETIGRAAQRIRPEPEMTTAESRWTPASVEVDPTVRATVPHLGQALADPSPEVRLAVVRALQLMRRVAGGG